MTKQFLVSAAAIIAAVTMVSGQETEKSFQVFGTAKGKGKAGAPSTFGSTIVKGKPFSATEEQHFLQVLGDGTRIETRQMTRVYRDGEGRMRLEDTTPGGQTQPVFKTGPITIIDPVENTNTTIDPQKRMKQTQPVSGLGRITLVNPNGAQGSTVILNGGQGILQIAQPGGGKDQPVEDLGTKTVNGVMAHGERTVTLIPAAEIGANRDIRVVNERWYSDDLQLLIKSTNTDPRFGDTTYQLTGIAQGEQSSSLFQVPADYTEAAGRGGGRGARSGGAPDADPLTGAPKGRGKGKGPAAVTK